MKNIKGLDPSEVKFKDAFVERYTSLTDWDAFKAACLTRLRRSIRVNTLKISVTELKERLSRDFNLTPIPWNPEGFWIEHKGERRDIGNTLEHQLGYYYIQEAVSMVPPLAIMPSEGSIGLDMCAAPGSKTSQLSQMMKNSGAIVANDYRGDRLASLGMNLLRCGALNVTVTLMLGERFKQYPNTFDWVLCDAPCSGTGTIPKSLKTLLIWNPHMITKIAKQQKGILAAAYEVCKPGGTIVYSTCSVEPEEDEGVIDDLLMKHPDALIEEVKLQGLKHSPPIMKFGGREYNPQVSKAIRIWPQDNMTEGFFVCKIRKGQ